ncbi:MAG: hypothetical protein ACT4PL_09175 [Phycisphaerales bacterium]
MSEGTSQTLLADWADVDAAVDIAMSRTEAAIFRSNPATEHYRLYAHEMVNIHGTKGLLRIERIAAPDRPGPMAADRLATVGRGAEELRLTCRIGPQGDQVAEQALLAAIISRLDELRGSAAALIRDEAFMIKY